MGRMWSVSAKVKLHKRYELGTKVSAATTRRGGWFVDALAFHGNPYDEHTLSKTLEQVCSIVKSPEHVTVERSCREHEYSGDITVYVDKQRRGATSRSLCRWIKHRAAFGPSIGHLKQEHRMDRNRLKGVAEDCIDAILSAAGMVFRKPMKFLDSYLLYICNWLVFPARPSTQRSD